jgi:hypothetical protein
MFRFGAPESVPILTTVIAPEALTPLKITLSPTARPPAGAVQVISPSFKSEKLLLAELHSLSVR